jgi:hypothetical protein
LVKKLKNRIRYLEANKEQWKCKAHALEEELARMTAHKNRDLEEKKPLK